MGSNRTIQTILQAIMVVLLAAMAYRLPAVGGRAGGREGGLESAPVLPSEKEIKDRFYAYFADDKEASAKAEGLEVSVEDISLEGAVAHVKLRLKFRWEGHNSQYTEGPLKNAPGNRGDRVQYTEIFRFRRWGKGWDIEGRREPPLIQ
ncbi:MAG TPA: hypothetical protein VNE39_12955 [Planctomycetota bacterium]|nr:hypothetical protein [Planctomycetota bacterium]